MELYCIANYNNNGWTIPGLFKLIRNNDGLYWLYECPPLSGRFSNIKERHTIFISDKEFVRMDGLFKFEESHLNKVYEG